MSTTAVDRWLGDPVARYDADERDHDRVAELFEAAGYERVDGVRTKDGDTHTAELPV